MSSVEEPRSLAEKGRQRRGRRFGRATLMLLVFSSGVAVMGLEMSASRLIAPYFGSTLSVWTSLIGLILIFLTGGYFVGGVLADRYPSPVLLGLLVVTAGALVTVVPALSDSMG